MSCYSIVTLNLELKASADEILEAASGMGFKVISASDLCVETDSVRFIRDSPNSAWAASGANSFDSTRFRREVARAKVLSEAKRQGYRITQDVRQGDRLVIRMKLQ